MTKIRVLIVDDHQMVIDGLKALLMGIPDIVVIGQALHGRQALRQLLATRVDIVLMDINMPEMNGLHASQEIRSRFPEVKIVMLTTNTSPLKIQQFIHLGVSAYLPKITDKDELITAIRKVAAGDRYFPPKIMETLTQSQQQAQAPLMISPREQQVLDAIVTGKTTDEIATELHLGKQTIHTYRKNLLKKFHVKNTASLVREAILQGFVADS
ncbi:MAG: response regulator transcription factor [Bacteroidota bacterium]